MVAEPNSLEKPEFLKDLESINDQLSKPDTGQHQSESPRRSDVSELADARAVDGAGIESRLNQELEQACLAMGATGAAIALVRGEEIVCHATTGPHSPDIGACVSPRTGLSGSCIQTRQLQQCNDTQTDPRVDSDACRSLGARSTVVLPLMHDGVLFGIFDILSSQPDAFGQRDLHDLQILNDRILESRRWDGEATATAPQRGSGSLHKSEVVASHNQSPPSASDSNIPLRERASN